MTLSKGKEPQLFHLTFQELKCWCHPIRTKNSNNKT